VNNKPCLILGEEETLVVLASTLTKYIVFNVAFHLVFVPNFDDIFSIRAVAAYKEKYMARKLVLNFLILNYKYDMLRIILVIYIYIYISILLYNFFLNIPFQINNN
jgi:hypothetical protein